MLVMLNGFAALLVYNYVIAALLLYSCKAE